MEQVKQDRLKLLNRKARRALQAMGRGNKTAKVYLIIDDSLVEKTGKKMEAVAKHRSHKEKNKLSKSQVEETNRFESSW